MPSNELVDNSKNGGKSEVRSKVLNKEKILR
jgi:hypothetical protein